MASKMGENKELRGTAALSLHTVQATERARLERAVLDAAREWYLHGEKSIHAGKLLAQCRALEHWKTKTYMPELYDETADSHLRAIERIDGDMFRMIGSLTVTKAGEK